jgi:hypothetical protein
MWPELGSMMRLIIFRVVLLPHPDGPTSTRMSPLGISSTAGLTSARPVTVLRRMGSNAYMKRAMKADQKPSPTTGMKIVKSASEGRVMNTEAMPRATSFWMGLSCTQTPMPTPTIVAATITVTM